MKVRTKKGIVDITKSVEQFSEAVRRLGNTANNTAKAVSEMNHSFYLLWKSGFKPQSQNATWILPALTILFGLAVIAWYVLVRF